MIVFHRPDPNARRTACYSRGRSRHHGRWHALEGGAAAAPGYGSGGILVSGAASPFFSSARLWRRAGIMTDVELAELRYSGRPAAFLRGFRALYLGLFINSVIMAWVNLAMGAVLEG